MKEENPFDRVAREWDRNQMHAERTQAIARAMLRDSRIKTGIKALEFGAGTGLLSIALLDRFTEVVLMDSSEEMVQVTRDKIQAQGLSKLRPVYFDLEKEDDITEKFDLVFMQMALHHVQDLQGVCRKFHAMLNPGGVIAIADLYPEDGSFHEPDFRGHRGFNPEALKDILSGFGFYGLHDECCYILKKTREDGTVKEYPIFLMTGERG